MRAGAQPSAAFLTGESAQTLQLACGLAVPVETLLTPAQLAEWLQVERSYVYEHAAELGAIRLGTGPRARLRFDFLEVQRRLTCSTSKGSDEPSTPVTKPNRRRRTARDSGTNVQLLPIRGVK